MTVLRDLYRPVKPLRRRVGRSGDGKHRFRSQQGRHPDPTLSDPAPSSPGDAARREMEGRRFETMFLADWVDVVFLHYEVDREALQEVIPFPLDERNGKCFVSFVAFTMRGMRFARGGALTRWMTAPIATHRFLNLRTYVRTGERKGIFFMKEWLDNPLSIPLGPKTFGLPYDGGDLRYEHSPGEVSGKVSCGAGNLDYEGRPEAESNVAERGTMDAFLVERYTAFTAAGRRPKFFRVWHEPWRIAGISELKLNGGSIFEGLSQAWTESARLVRAHYSPGVKEVWMGRPHFA